MDEPPAISTYVREQFFNGLHDPDAIAKAYLRDALSSKDPEAWFMPAVRHSVGSAFSSIQAAVRGSKETTRDRITGSTSRQGHNNSYVFNPDTREWIPLGQATVADFQAAIHWHERMIEGHQATIDEYRSYIQRIRKAGVTCLDEL